MMQHKQSTIISLLLLLSITSTENAQGRRVGGRSQVKDVRTNKEIQDLGRFSVNEYNRSVLDDIPPTPLRGVVAGDQPYSQLRFLEVVDAQRQVVSGLKYYLKVKAMQEDGSTRSFEAIVVVKPWEHHSKKLLNFGPTHKS